MSAEGDSRPEPELVARASSTHVMFDYETERTAPVTDDFKRRVLDFQGTL